MDSKAMNRAQGWRGKVIEQMSVKKTVCAKCLESHIDRTDTDEAGVFWTYCRACDFWTEHE